MSDPGDLEEAAEAVDGAAEEFARLSPAARRFMAGEMDEAEAVRLGFRRAVE